MLPGRWFDESTGEERVDVFFHLVDSDFGSDVVEDDSTFRLTDSQSPLLCVSGDLLSTYHGQKLILKMRLQPCQCFVWCMSADSFDDSFEHHGISCRHRPSFHC